MTRFVHHVVYGEHSQADNHHSLEDVTGNDKVATNCVDAVGARNTELEKMCAAVRIPGDFDVSLIIWRPDYDRLFYRQLSRRARRTYLFRSEYVFDLEKAVAVETPQLGHATYLFSKPRSMAGFLAIYTQVTKEEVRHNHGNVAEKLGFLGRVIHGTNPRAWLKELRQRLGE